MGVTGLEIKKLQEGGFYTVESVAYSTKKALMATKGISEQKAEKLLVNLLFLPLVLSDFLVIWYFLFLGHRLQDGSDGLHHCHRVPYQTI